MTRDSLTQPDRRGTVIGVDTPRDTHTAVALDAIGCRLGEMPATMGA